MEVTQRLSEALSQVAPRLDASGHGCFWLEPFIPRGEPDLASGEEAFATRVLEAIHVEGFAHGRVGVANGVITAYAAACHGGASVSRVAPGDEIRFLGRLPCSALPMSPRTLGLLEGVGVTRISALQALDSSSLIARFGREGEKLYALARGLDHRAPRTPPEREASSVHVPLAAPCQTIEPLVFVIRGALDRLLSDQARRGLAIGRVRVWLHREVSSPSPGAEEPWQIEVAPSRPTTRARLLMELIRVALSERFQETEEGLCGFIDALTIEIPERTPATIRQADLFAERAQDPAILERVLLRLAHRLGPRAVRRPERVETRHPDQGGHWRRVDRTSERTSGPPELSHGACYRRLDQPLHVQLSAPDQLDLRGLGEKSAGVIAWRGEERRAGQWWSQRYDRDYVWAELEDGRMFRLYRARESQRWYIEGWLD